MRQHLRAAKRPTHLQPLALAAAMLMAAQAQAQAPAPSFTQNGANSTAIPSACFPINPAARSRLLGQYGEHWRRRAGSFSALAGALLKADVLTVAKDGLGTSRPLA